MEYAIRNALSIGGDSDMIAAMTGSISEVFYKVDKQLEEKALSYLSDHLVTVYQEVKEFIKSI